MKKFATTSCIALLLILSSCNGTNSSGTLNTSKLIEVKMGDVTEQQKKNIPITYEAPSLEDGLDALPFKITLPNKLPFDAKPFQPPIINDMTHDGKKLMVEFKTTSKTDYEQQITLIITVYNEEVKNGNPDFELINLNEVVMAGYINNAIHFNYDGVSYTITYINPNISADQHRKEIIEMATQML